MTLKTDKDFLEVALLVAAIFCVVSVGFCAIAVYQFILTGRQESTATDQHLNRVLIVAGATLTNIEKASRSIDDREQAELKQVNAVMGGLQITVAKVNVTVDSLNALVVHSDTRMGTLADNTNTDLNDLHPALVNLNGSIASLNAAIKPIPGIEEDLHASLMEVPPTLKKFQVVEDNLGTVSGNAAAITDSGRKIAKHYEDEILKPVKKARLAWGYFAGWWATVLGKAMNPW
jgi:hypothetical protein